MQPEPQPTPTASCAYCQAPIIWAQVGLHSSMPIDAEPVKNGNVRLYQRQATGTMHGRVYATVLGRTALSRLGPGVTLYRSHFATCPQAARFRRRP